MANPNKRKGDVWERAVVLALRRLGFPQAERTRAGWEDDRGDVDGCVGLVLQCKNTAAMRWNTWLSELDRQREAAGADHAVLVVKRPGMSDGGEGLAVMRLSEWTRLARQAGYGSSPYTNDGSI